MSYAHQIPSTSAGGGGCVTGDELRIAREAALRQHAFFQLHVHLKEGHRLIAKDIGGTDCYSINKRYHISSHFVVAFLCRVTTYDIKNSDRFDVVFFVSCA